VSLVDRSVGRIPQMHSPGMIPWPILVALLLSPPRRHEGGLRPLSRRGVHQIPFRLEPVCAARDHHRHDGKHERRQRRHRREPAGHVTPLDSGYQHGCPIDHVQEATAPIPLRKAQGTRIGGLNRFLVTLSDARTERTSPRSSSCPPPARHPSCHRKPPQPKPAEPATPSWPADHHTDAQGPTSGVRLASRSPRRGFLVFGPDC
jgi:hypothetical protein